MKRDSVQTFSCGTNDKSILIHRCFHGIIPNRSVILSLDDRSMNILSYVLRRKLNCDMDENNMNQEYYQQPVQNYGQPQQGYQQSDYNNGSRKKPERSPSFTKLLVFSILQALCCNTITGIIALVLTFTADSAYKSGDIEGYESKKKIAIIVLIVGVVLALLIGVITVVAGIFDVQELVNY